MAMSRRDYIAVAEAIRDSITRCKADNSPINQEQLAILIQAFCENLEVTKYFNQKTWIQYLEDHLSLEDLAS